MGTGTEVQGGKGQGGHKAQGRSHPQQPRELRWEGSSGGGHDLVTLGWVEGELFFAAQGEERDRQGCAGPPPGEGNRKPESGGSLHVADLVGLARF